ncbi:Creatinase/aminopeptidase [Balamuthia mandrillaris]
MESKQAGAKPNSSGERLARLRELLRAQKLDAFVVPTNDAHMSEYIAECDKRRQFISGFTGSAGTAVIPLEGKARLWTDGRYFLQATTELDDNWVLMKDRLPETPSVPEWLSKELAAGSRVGIDAKVMSVAEARTYLNTFMQHDIELVSVEENPVDIVWGEAKPPAPLGKVMVHPLSYAGQSYQDKIAQLRGAMANAKVAAVVVSALDEVAWLLNIRGSDIPFNPVVQAYILVTKEDISLYIDKHKLDEEAEQHLSDVKLLPYNQIFDDLKQLNAENKRVWVDSQKCSKALADCLSTTNTYENFSPLSLPKAIKNETELEGLRQCHLRDAAALINFFSWLETAIESGTETEVSVSDKLEGFRKEQKDFISLSFDTIAGSGPNGAIIHYKPAPESCAIVRKDQMFLCDSGGQYRDGTTDVTRTMHFGSPSQYEKHCFTRVLQGHISLSMAIFPNGTTGQPAPASPHSSVQRNNLLTTNI